MVDFRKLRSTKVQPPATDPIEIFRRLPKPPEITVLYTSQAEVLKAWYDRQDERDLVIKLHTGGGKTLVGLLIAQSIMNKTHEPVLYLSPTTQLVDQIAEKARAYSIPAVVYEKERWGELPEEFLNGQSVLICTYHALFNARSRFGVRGTAKEIIHVAGIILDDAHVAFSTMREASPCVLTGGMIPRDTCTSPTCSAMRLAISIKPAPSMTSCLEAACGETMPY